MTSKRLYSSDLEYQGASRHILVFLDGTWNDENGKDGDGVVTNIYKLFSSISGSLDDSDVPFKRETPKQIALYFRGVGNDEDHSAVGTFYQGAFGAGEKRIRDNAYSELIRHYRKGDKISIFGFSRGAACARLLASKIHKYGIKHSIEVRGKEKDGEFFFLSYKHKNEENLKVDIEFLGVFDTVGAFGIPINLPGLPFQKINLFKNLKVAANVKQTVHCVAIDESREPFIPTLCNRADNVDEVWFAGVHADVGGAYHFAELGKIALSYMVSKLNLHFLNIPIKYRASALKDHTKYSVEKDQIRMHYHGDGVKKEPRHIYVSSNGKVSSQAPKIHHTVLQLMGASDVRCAEEFASFTSILPVIYGPRNLQELGATLEVVEDG
jgi:uncharacterized protein (DUF2235 family)